MLTELVAALRAALHFQLRLLPHRTLIVLETRDLNAQWVCMKAMGHEVLTLHPCHALFLAENSDVQRSIQQAVLSPIIFLRLSTGDVSCEPTLADALLLLSSGKCWRWSRTR